MTMGEKWELKIHRARELRKKGSELLFDRVRLLVECFDDQGFRDWCADQGVDYLDCLDGELSDTAANFMTLRAVYLVYPDQESWVKNNIRDLMAQVLDQEKKKPSDQPSVSWKSKFKAAELSLAASEKARQEAEQRADRYEKECERLRAELASLRETLSFSVLAVA